MSEPRERTVSAPSDPSPAGGYRILVLSEHDRTFQELRALLVTACAGEGRFDWMRPAGFDPLALNEPDYDLVLVSSELSSLDAARRLRDSGLNSLPLVVFEHDAPLPGPELLRALAACDALTRVELEPPVLRRVLLRSTAERRCASLLAYRRDFERLVARVSSLLVHHNEAELDAGLVEALAAIGEFTASDRGYVLQFSPDRRFVTMTHEWRRDGFERVAAYYQQYPVEAHTWLLRRLAAGEIVTLADSSDVPAEGEAFRSLLDDRKVRAVALAPLLSAGNPIGVLGFSVLGSARAWSAEARSIFHIVSEVIASALERRRSGEALRESESRFRTLVESLGEGILFCDRDDVVLHVNGRMCELTGHTRREMIGSRADYLLLPAGQGHLLRDRTARRLRGISERYEIQLQRKDGSRFWAEINATPIRDTADRIVGTLGAVTDVSDRKLAIEALRASEKKYRDLVETSRDLIWSVDGEGRWTFVNQAARSIYGYEPAEMLGRPFTEFTKSELAGRDFEAFKSVLVGRSVFKYETEHIRKDGTPVHLSFNAIALRDRDGAVYGTTGTATDITSRRAAELALREREAYLREVIDTSPNMIFAKDRRHRYTLVNRAMAALYGREVEEMLGRTDREIVSDQEEAQRFEEADREIFTSGKTLHFGESRFRDPRTGQERWFQVIKKPLRSAGGEITEVLGVATDLTDRKAAEAEAMQLQRRLLQSQKLEAIGQLAAGVAHDLNNSLAAVVGHLQLMRASAGEGRDAEASMEQALVGCERATSLIGQLLGFSRQGKYNLESLCIQEAVRQTVDFLGKVIGTDVRIESRGVSEALHVRADAAQLQQALTNLVINAKQAMPAGGTITFSYAVHSGRELRRGAGEAADEYVVLSVSDTGHGIPKEDLDKVFDPFFTTRHEEHGTGLGLAMVYGIASNHGGWVEAESEMGAGSTFSLYFPRAEPAAVRPAPPEQRAERAGTGTVLVIDDEEVLVDLMSEFLRRAGIASVGFSDPGEALEWFGAHAADIDLVVLDMKMPRIDGRGCYTKLRQIRPDIGVVVLSGYSQDVAAQEVLRAGALKFFQKPLHYPEVVAWIGDFLAAAHAGRSRRAVG